MGYMDMKDRIRQRMTDLGLTQFELAERVGISQPMVVKLLKGAGTRNILAIAKALECSPEWLESGAEGRPHNNDYTVSQQPRPVRYVPLVSFVQAGEWCEAEDPYPPSQGERMIAVDALVVSEMGYALRVEGPSMEPKFYAGDILIVDPSRQPVSGNYVIAKRTSSQVVTFKQLVIEGGEMYLRALNPDWPERIIRLTEEWTICGVVVQRVETF